MSFEHAPYGSLGIHIARKHDGRSGERLNDYTVAARRCEAEILSREKRLEGLLAETKDGCGPGLSHPSPELPGLGLEVSAMLEVQRPEGHRARRPREVLENGLEEFASLVVGRRAEVVSQIPISPDGPTGYAQTFAKKVIRVNGEFTVGFDKLGRMDFIATRRSRCLKFSLGLLGLLMPLRLLGLLLRLRSRCRRARCCRTRGGTLYFGALTGLGPTGPCGHGSGRCTLR